ncbi:MAG: HAD family hydrolase [Flammeovirgaceae bacterium]
MKQYKNIIFDLGGVIINLDYQATTNAFTKLCGRDMSEVYSQKRQDPIFDDIETGKISPHEFREGLKQLFNFEASHDQIDAVWNALLLDIPPSRIDLLKQLKAQKRIFLLSNTNAIHKIAFERILKKATGIPKLDPLFEKAYYSHELNDRKPNVSIFERVIDENALNPAETLFIDDSAQHIIGAKQAGLHAYHLTAPTTILDLGLV